MIKNATNNKNAANDSKWPEMIKNGTHDKMPQMLQNSHK